MVGFVSVGAPAVVGKKNGVAVKLGNKVGEFEGLTSFFSFHCILYQEAMCAKSLNMSHVMDIVVKTANIICSSAFNYQKFVGLLEEIESEHSEIIYHTNVRWLSQGSVLQICDLLKEIKFFYDKRKYVKIMMNYRCMILNFLQM
jgi:hypothetical protein